MVVMSPSPPSAAASASSSPHHSVLRFSACQLGPLHSPDYFDQFTHVDMVWDKELGLVQHWKLFLPFIAFDDDLGRKTMVGLARV